MLQELYDYTLTPAGLIQVWPTEGAEPYEFPITDLLAWASLEKMKKYETDEVEYFDETYVYVIVLDEFGDDMILPMRISYWWDEIGAKDRLLIDYLNSEITGRRDSIPAAFATEQEKNRGSADGLPII